MRSSCAIYKGCKGYKGGARSLKKDIAYFSAGCFWKVEEKFSKLDGVVVTDVGYMGGNRKNPSYQSFKNRNSLFAETVKVTYLPNKISYLELVNFFFKIHDPTTKNKQGPDVGKKYRSIVFYKNKSQQSDYMQVLNSLRYKQRVVTELLSASKYKFHIAEKFHQQYINKKKGILTENITVFEKICMKNTTRAENKYSGRYTKEPYLSGKIIWYISMSFMS